MTVCNFLERVLILRHMDAETLLLYLTSYVLRYFKMFRKFRTKLMQRLHENSRLKVRFGSCRYVCRTSDLLTLFEAHRKRIYNIIPRFMPKPGNIVVDGGANIGEFAIPAAKLVGEGGKVIAFEPNSEAVSLLRSNAEINGLKNLTIMPKAICDKDGLVKIYTNPVSNVSDGIVPFGESFGRPFDKDSPANYLTKSVKLDTVLCSEKKINLIKLDIEGAEYLALLGTRRILKKKPRIIVELHSEPLRKLVLSHLKQLGYYVVHEVPFSKSVSVAYLEVSSK